MSLYPKARRWVACLAVLAACGGDATLMGSVVRDSAGVTIVELDPNAPPVATWRVEDAPVTVIGAVETDETQQFVRIRKVLRNDDGDVYVLDGPIGEVRVFDAGGAFRRTIGRKGNGPGEFRMPMHMWLGADDSLHVWDAQYGPLSVFDASGRLDRTEDLDRAGLVRLLDTVQPYEGAIPVNDESLVIPSRSDPGGPFQPPEGPYRPSLEMMLVRPSAGESIHLGTYGGVSQQWLDGPGEPVPIILPFWRHYQIATSARHGLVALGDTDVYEIRIHTADGRLLQVVRRPDGPWRRGPTAVELDDEKALRLAGTSPDLQAWRARAQDEATDPDLFPAHGRLLFDDEGNLWVEEYRTPADTVTRWTVFGRDGTPLSLVATPVDLVVHHIGRNHVAGVRRDDLDVETVAVHALTGHR